MDWWWCLQHEQVEQGPGCPNMKRLGPYATREEAESAPARVAARAAAQDADDAADDDWGKPPSKR